MYAVIDLETTGGNAVQDRITEIAIIVHDGSQVLREFSSLINPECRIPAYITDITGISSDMVADAPKFYEVAREVVELTEGCIFVAHNVGFDYGFLREEFRRLGYDFKREKLCTVRTSRSLIPGLPSYSLGKLCAYLGIPIHARHRAKGDADATVLLLERLIQVNPSLSKPDKSSDPYAGLPNTINRQGLDLLPEDPGIYFFHDREGKVRHQAAARSIRQSALKELQQALKKPAKTWRSEEVCDVTFEQTGSELVAKLLLLQQQADELPAKKRSPGKFAVQTYTDQRGYLRAYVDKLQKGKQGYGQFPTEGDALSALESRMRKYGLCRILGGFEQGSGPCIWCDPDLGSCKAACEGKEPPQEYNQRFMTAMKGLGFPHPAFFLVTDGRQHEEIGVVAIEHGHLLGYAFLDASFGWDNPHAVKELLKPLPSNEQSLGLLKQHLTKAFKQQMVPYE